MLFLLRTNNIQIWPYVIFFSEQIQIRPYVISSQCYFFPEQITYKSGPMLFFLRTNSIGRAIGAPGGRVKVTIWPWPACPSDTEMILRKQTVLLPFHAQRALIVAIAHRRKFHLSYQDALPISHTLPRPAQFLITDYCNTDLGCTIRLA